MSEDFGTIGMRKCPDCGGGITGNQGHTCLSVEEALRAELNKVKGFLGTANNQLSVLQVKNNNLSNKLNTAIAERDAAVNLFEKIVKRLEDFYYPGGQFTYTEIDNKKTKIDFNPHFIWMMDEIDNFLQKYQSTADEEK